MSAINIHYLYAVMHSQSTLASPYRLSFRPWTVPSTLARHGYSPEPLRVEIRLA